MALPKLSFPTFLIKIPSKGETKRFRPFLVKEEKILLLAQQGDEKDVVFAIKQILNNCCIESLDVDSLAIFDVEYIFLQLRAKSINNIIELKYRDNEDGEVYSFQLNLEEIDVVYNPDHTNKIKISEDVGIVLKYPSFDAIKDIIFDDVEGTVIFDKILTQCIDKVYDAENVYPASEYTEKEVSDFVDGLEHKTFKQIENFFRTMPKIYHELKYTNNLGHERTIRLENIKDFFTWR